MDALFGRLRDLAEQELEGIVHGLPSPLRDRARTVTVTLELRPSQAQCSDGVEPDTLGLFLGPDYADQDCALSPLPPQIVLFLANLWELAEGNEAIFRRETRTTYLHELGHYLGLDEDDLFDRGLD